MRIKGFTFIELMVVIALVAILAVILFPKYFNLSSSAQSNTTNIIASKLNSAARMNYYARTLNSKAGTKITNCRNIGNLLEGGLKPGYSIKSTNIPNNEIVACTLNGPNNSSAIFYARGIR